MRRSNLFNSKCYVMNEFENIENKRNKIPRVLLITGILSILGTLPTIMAGIQAALSGKPSEEEIIKTKLDLAKSLEEVQKYKFDYLEDLIRNLQLMMEAMFNNFVVYNLVAASVAAIGLAGVVFMFLRRELGFHLYIIYSLLYVGQSYLFVPPSNVPILFVIVNFLFSGLFIFLYSLSLKWLKKID